MGTDREIVHIDHQPLLSDVVGKVMIHERLESQGRSAESKEHYCWFKQSQEGDECGLPLIPLFYLHIVVSPSYVEFGEMRELSEIIDQVRDQR